MVNHVYLLAKWLAYLGGFLLTAIAAIVVVSVSGRALISIGLGPVPGDFELVEMATAVAVFFFLPWCYLKNGHAMVDIVYMHLPRPAQRFLTLFSDVLMLGAWLILTWRLGVSVGDKYHEGETTFILQMPVWWAYAVSLFGAAVGCATYLAKTLVEAGIASAPAGWSDEHTGGHV